MSFEVIREITEFYLMESLDFYDTQNDDDQKSGTELEELCWISCKSSRHWNTHPMESSTLTRIRVQVPYILNFFV